MDVNKVRTVINKRAQISKDTQDEWSDGIEACWKELTSLLVADIPSTIRFLNHECTAEEFSWISEVFDDVAKASQSKEFIHCIKNVALKFPEESLKSNIWEAIHFAEEEIA